MLFSSRPKAVFTFGLLDYRLARAWQLQEEGNENPDQKVKDIDIAMDS